jgi:hypothetical protein
MKWFETAVRTTSTRSEGEFVSFPVLNFVSRSWLMYRASRPLYHRLRNETVPLTFGAIPFVAGHDPTSSRREVAGLISIVTFRSKIVARPVAASAFAVAADTENAGGTRGLKSDHRYDSSGGRNWRLRGQLAGSWPLI